MSDESNDAPRGEDELIFLPRDPSTEISFPPDFFEPPPDPKELKAGIDELKARLDAIELVVEALRDITERVIEALKK